MGDVKSETSSRGEMGPLTKVLSDWVHEYFKKTEIEASGAQSSYKFTADGEGDFSFNCYVEVYEEKSRVMTFIYAPLSASPKKRTEVADLLARINFGLNYGKVTMDFDSGKLRFEGEIGVSGGVLSVAMINNVVDGGIGIMDHYLPAIMSVVHAEVSAVDAYANLGKDREDMRPPITPTSDAWGWERFVGVDPIKVWAEDLKKSVATKSDMDQWALTGRSAVIINSDEGYCRELLKRIAADTGMNFISVTSDEVMNLPDSSVFRTMAPVLVYLEPGRWMLAKAEEEESEEDFEHVEKFQYRLIESMRKFKPAKPVVFAVMAYQVDDVSQKLRQVGLFERYFAIPKRSLEMVAEDFICRIGKNLCDESLSNDLGKVGQLISWSFGDTEQQDLALLNLRRIQARRGEKLGFIDLVHIATHSMTEEEEPQARNVDERRQVAYHEAGHAVIAMLESSGKDIPDYTSIVPGASGFGGVTVESYGYFFSKGDNITSYEEFRRDIRVCLGGRAAEELIYGPEKIGCGASGDLESATKNSHRAFAHWGFAPGMERPGLSGSNLQVVLGKAYESEYVRITELVRQFLREEYEVVMDSLRLHQSLLDKVADRLLWDPVVDQDEMRTLYEGHQKPFN